MSVKIIVDSTVDIAEKYSSLVTVVPLTVSFGETDYIDGVTIDKQTFYQKLVTSKVLPKTSQATPDAFIKVFEDLQQKGEEAVVITVSSRLSGTYQSACIAAEDFPNIRVVDSMNVSIASGILAEYALRCAANGMGLDELAFHLCQKRDEIGLVAMVDTLEYLRKGGRISGAAALAGGVLNIKPVVTCRDGELAVLGKARGSKKAKHRSLRRDAAPVHRGQPVPLERPCRNPRLRAAQQRHRHARGSRRRCCCVFQIRCGTINRLLGTRLPWYRFRLDTHICHNIDAGF